MAEPKPSVATPLSELATLTPDQVLQRLGANLGLVPLRRSYAPWLVGILLCYCVLTQLVKRVYIRRFRFQRSRPSYIYTPTLSLPLEGERSLPT